MAWHHTAHRSMRSFVGKRGSVKQKKRSCISVKLVDDSKKKVPDVHVHGAMLVSCTKHMFGMRAIAINCVMGISNASEIKCFLLFFFLQTPRGGGVWSLEFGRGRDERAERGGGVTHDITQPHEQVKERKTQGCGRLFKSNYNCNHFRSSHVYVRAVWVQAPDS